MRRESISTREFVARDWSRATPRERGRRTEDGGRRTQNGRTTGPRQSTIDNRRPVFVLDRVRIYFWGPRSRSVPRKATFPPPHRSIHQIQYIQTTMSVSAVVSHVARRARGRAVSLARLFSTAEFDSVSSSVSAQSPVGGASGGLGHGGRTQGDLWSSFASGSRGFGRRFATNSHGTSVGAVARTLHPSLPRSLPPSLTPSLPPTPHQTS